MPRFDRLMEHIRVLCKELPPRQPTTIGERKAAEYVHGQVEKLGISSQIETFKGIPTLGLPGTIAALIGLLAIPFGWTTFPLGRWIAGILLLVCGATMYALYANLPPFFEKLIARWDSWNVVGNLKPAGEPKWRIYLLGHLDANKQRFLLPTPNPRLLKPSQTLTIALPVFVGLSFWAETLFNWNLFWLQALAVGFLAISILMLWFDETQPTVEGANDNASAVSVLLSMAEALQAQPLQNSEVILLFTGCEEVGHHGLIDYLRRYQPPAENAFWIDLELVGAGNLCYATRHGVTYLTEYCPGEEILRLAEKTAQAHPELGVSGREMLILEEVATLRHAGQNALCLMGYDEKGYLPFWHRLNDRLENLNPETLQHAAQFTWELVQAIDHSFEMS
jgi:hypothetical protein